MSVREFIIQEVIALIPALILWICYLWAQYGDFLGIDRQYNEYRNRKHFYM